MRKFFTFLLALAASVGMMNAKVTWNSSNISDLDVFGTDDSYSKEGVTLRGNADVVVAMWDDYGDESQHGITFQTEETGGFTFSNTLGKNFTKIEMFPTGTGGWENANLGSGWLFSGNGPITVTWTGNASTVDLVINESNFLGDPVKSIVFYFEGDSQESDPTYTVALEDGTANADKVTLSATFAIEGATITVTPNEEYEITAFSAYYVVVEDQLGSIYEIDATLDPGTGAYSFTMPAANVTIEATIALKPVPEGDIFAGFTATAGSGGIDNKGHANLVDGKFTTANWTKWYTDNDHKSVPTGESESCWWIDFEASAALNLTGYILTTGNDTGIEHGRNPKNWLLKAKLNADDAWTTIATVTNDVTMKNQGFKDYKFFVDQSGPYQYFRFEVFANQGADVMQLCELRLIGTEYEPTYLDADFAINFMSNPYTVVGGGALPTGVEVTGDFNDAQHGYRLPVITIPVTAGNYLVKMGACRFSNQDGSVKNEDGSVTYTTLATNTGVCYDANPSKNYVADIITIPSDQIIKVHGAEYTPYFSIQKMLEIPAFTDFELNFQTDPYSVSGTMPTGTNIAGTYHDNQHGYQNVEATIPMEAGTYRLTLGACQYGNGEGNVMSETNIELASFNQNLGENKCYHQNPSANIVSVTFTVDIDQNITINGGAYVPYMKLEKITAYHVVFALDDAEGTAPTAVDVTIGEDITMPVNKTMYKAGYTLTGWSDGVNTYPIGESFTPANDVVLTPVFTANEADLLNATTDVTIIWYFGGDNGAPTTSYEGTSGLLVAQATIGDKTVDVKLSIDATSGKFVPQPTTEWANVQVGTIFTYPYKEGMTVNVGNYKSYVTYYIADEEGKVVCYYENDLYSFIEVTYPASQPTAVENVQTNHVQATKFFRDGQLLIEKNGKTYNATGAEVK